MKRSWASVAAFVPFTIAVSPAGDAVAEPENSPSRARAQGDVPGEKPDENLNAGGADNTEEAGMRSKSPSHEFAIEDTSFQSGGGDEVEAARRASADSQDPVSVPTRQDKDAHVAGGNPGSSEGREGGPLAAGGGQSKQNSMVSPDDGDAPGSVPTSEAEADAGTASQEGGPPDPTDADSMMISLGGTAIGSGDGATSSADMALDIVDYGAVTIGYGYAIYEASGEDAFAETFAEVAGADLVFRHDVAVEQDGTQSSATYVLAIDFEFEDGVAEDSWFNQVNWSDLLAQGPFALWITDEEADLAIDQNVSTLDYSVDVQDETAPTMDIAAYALSDHGSIVSAEVESEQAMFSLRGEIESFDSLAVADVSLIEIEDHFSSVSGSLTGIG